MEALVEYLGSDQVDLSSHRLAHNRGLLCQKLLAQILKQQGKVPALSVTLRVAKDGVHVKHSNPECVDVIGSFHALRHLVFCKAHEPGMFSLLSAANCTPKHARFHSFRCLSMAEAKGLCHAIRTAFDHTQRQKHQRRHQHPQEPRQQPEADSHQQATKQGRAIQVRSRKPASAPTHGARGAPSSPREPSIPQEDALRDDDAFEQASSAGRTLDSMSSEVLLQAAQDMGEDADGEGADAPSTQTSTGSSSSSSSSSTRRRRRYLFRRRDTMAAAEGKPSPQRAHKKRRQKKVQSKHGLVTNRDELDAVASLPNTFPMFEDTSATLKCYMCGAAVRAAAACCPGCLTPLVDALTTRNLNINITATNYIHC